MESTIEFREESLKVKGETGPGMSVRQHGESRVELGRECRRGCILGDWLVNDLE